MMVYNSESYIPDQYEEKSIQKTGVKDLEGVSPITPQFQVFTLNRKILDSYDNRLFPGYDGNTQVYYEIHRFETMTISVPGIV